MNNLDEIIEKYLHDEKQDVIHEMAAYTVEEGAWNLVFWNVKTAGAPQRIELHERKKGNKRHIIPFSASGFDFSQLGAVPDHILLKVEEMLKRPNVLKLAIEYWTNPYVDQSKISKALGL